MVYTIKQAAEKLNLTAYTLRYYDKEGLLPFVERNDTGNRLFTDNSMEWLSLICCLKESGMPIKQIRDFIQSCMEGDETLENRRQMLIEHRKEVIRQISELKHNLDKINHKIAYYDTLCNPPLKEEPEPAYSLSK